MPDNLKHSANRDDQRINIIQDFEVRYWTAQLKVTEEILRKGVLAVGPMVNDLRRWIKENRYDK
ncbi:MAG TPA: DUF3606 domain-containing protein [Flavitalea sp.]|jgi:hypothetical protein|nr:DUF3606 domain-containing protein [Flavitalea sp.]